ncbi:lantibiotic dehydratase [Paenibacillus ginsengarvi]|uniref:lantibiotic dehydratase n=1 Tax=Paenibacillus ginsengarvi TaxID=400777 RepID=UPI00195F3D8F|nr:lantibiotic dehydratase [Paenibacillus ginsengarvi]
MARPDIREAIFLASPDLEDQIRLWIEAPANERGKTIESALVRYVCRMSGRATPFGLFAGYSIGTVGRQTSMTLPPIHAYRRHTRLDMDYIFSLAETLGNIRELRSTFAYYPNSSLYRTAGRYRYAEARLHGANRSYHLVAVDPTEYLDRVLELAQAGAGFGSLVDALVAHDPEITPEEGAEYLHELIDSQILMPGIMPTVTGGEAIRQLISRLEGDPATAQEAKHLAEVEKELEELDASGLGIDPGRYREIGERLTVLPAKVELPRLFQVDMTKPAPNLTVGQEVLEEITKGIQILHRLSRLSQKSFLDQFREAFLTRYGDQEVPLAEALDEETGIGFREADAAHVEPSPLIEGLVFPSSGNESRQWGKSHAVLLHKLAEALSSGAREISIDTKDVDEMAGEEIPPPLPDAFSVTARLAASTTEAVEHGDFQVWLKGGGGPSGARLFGRFCSSDQVLHSRVRDHLREEEAFRPDAVFAEIVHLPEGRIGNVIARPVLREYEIVYLGRSGAPIEKQIPIHDLTVSVEGERIILHSVRLRKQVIPRMSTAHNFDLPGLGIYRFLCSLQSEEVASSFGWNWGPLSTCPFLPRVVHGRLVLSRAQWYVTKAELRALGELQGAARCRSVREWAAKRGIPGMFVLADFDNELPVDLDNVLSLESFVELVKGRDAVKLTELFPAPDRLIASGPEGSFVHELVIPFVRQAESADLALAVSAPQRPASSQISLSRRVFLPGSEWLYAKLYTGTATADRVLREVIRPVTAKALQSGAADRWFFIRYGDPDFHLRLRFHGDPQRLLTEVLPALRATAAPLLNDGSAWRVQLDTYVPEWNRYGGPEGIRAAEELFHLDSEAVLALVETFHRDDRDARWRLALRGIHLLLDDLGLDMDKKIKVISRARDGFAQEFGVDKALRIQLGQRFRKERSGIEEDLTAGPDSGNWLAPGFAILQERSERIQAAAEHLQALQRLGTGLPSIDQLAASFIHMYVNRLLRSAHRAQELVLYDYLARVYESWSARMRGGG